MKPSFANLVRISAQVASAVRDDGDKTFAADGRFGAHVEALVQLLAKERDERDALLEMLEKIHEAEFGFGCWPTSDEIVAMIAKAKGGAV